MAVSSECRLVSMKKGSKECVGVVDEGGIA